MPRCEDYPCCGHTDGEGCPDTSDDRFYPYPCVECGGRIRRSDAAPGHESFHASCLDGMSDDDREHDREDLDDDDDDGSAEYDAEQAADDRAMAAYEDAAYGRDYEEEY